MATGIDIGRSGVKIAGDGRELEIFPALACPAVRVEDGDEAQRARLQTLDYQGTAWFWGETAQIHGKAAPGNDPGFELSPAYAVLLRAAVQRARAAGLGLDRVALGVPSEAGQRVRQHVAQSLQAILPQARIRVVAQPAGVLACAAAHRAGLMQQTVAIIDIGRYSTDVAISLGGRPVAGSLFSLPGVRVAVEDLALQLRDVSSGTIAFDTLEGSLRTGELMHRLQRLDVRRPAHAARLRLRSVVEQALSRIQVLQPDVQAVLLAGGGADLLDLEGLPAMERAPGGRYAVARGLARIAAGL